MKILSDNPSFRGQQDYITELESIRGIAILLVFLLHAHGMAFPGWTGEATILQSFILAGNTGVTLFFVLSGFLLSIPFLKANGNRCPPSTRKYFLSRTLRILPLYYFMIVVALLVTGKISETIPASAFIFIGFDVFPFSVVWWTLATEVQFYVLLPVIMLLLRSPLGRLTLMLSGVIWAYFYIELTLGSPGHPGTAYHWAKTKSLFARLPAFAIGIAGAYIYLQCKKPDRNRYRIPSTIILWSTLIVLGLVLQQVVEMGSAVAERRWHMRHTYESLCWIGIILCLCLGEPYGKRFFINSINRTLGKLSYSIYLVHVPILFYIFYPMKMHIEEGYFFDNHIAYLALGLGAAGTLLTSALSYKFIEQPFLNLKKTLMKPATQHTAITSNIAHKKTGDIAL